MKHLHLGASLYVPATRGDLVQIGNRAKHPGLRSVIFCTEDAIRSEEVVPALSTLARALPAMEPDTGILRFIRVRSPHILGEVLKLPGIGRIDGFVLPKTTLHSMKSYLALLGPRDPFMLMPTLETAEVFDEREMIAFRDLISDESVRRRILALRIGGNDLLHCLGVRRSPRRTIYESALGPVIARLATTFLPHGFHLTAPVFEGLSHPEVLRAEVTRDIDHGLLGKTAVHPDQIAHIEAMYAVEPEDLEMATAMLAPNAPAVFRMHDTMCEEATHTRWARMILGRHRVFGLAQPVQPRPRIAALA